MRAGRGVGEQHLHIARPHLPGVAAVGRSGVAGDPPHDLDLVGVVEPGGGEPVGIVDDQRHLGEMPRATAGGTVEDHIFHPAAPHRRGAVFAHHPAERLQKVRLAATIRPDHAGQPLMDHQIRGVDEAFEAVEAKAGQAHGNTFESKGSDRPA